MADAVKLYLASIHDQPHARDGMFVHTKCGQPIAGMKPITEAQALVFLGDARCPKCFTSWAQTRGHASG